MKLTRILLAVLSLAAVSVVGSYHPSWAAHGGGGGGHMGGGHSGGGHVCSDEDDCGDD
jgi:hypothetical protein